MTNRAATVWLVSAASVLALSCGADEDGRADATAASSVSIGSLESLSSPGTAGDDASSGGATNTSAPGTGDEADSSASSPSSISGGVFDVGTNDPLDGTGAPMDCAGDQDLVAIVRDFQIAHPDFEYEIAVDPGIVQEMLGGDDKPVYAGPTPTTTNQANFDQWYRDVVGVNQTIMLPMVLTEGDAGTYFFDDQAFFPIDGQGWGNEGNDHNFHFTLELHTEFVYEGGEIFSFTGDDDLFTFVNGHLAIDLGGVHGAMNGTIDLDAQAAELGITPGNTYRLDFFFAERHTSESHFRIDTTIGCLVDVPVG